MAPIFAISELKPLATVALNTVTKSEVDDKSHVSKLSPMLQKLGADKKQTKDGQVPKRRGPKPDTKPALTRRQELNRQAQRTHRERKEMYIKALEEEVMRLKDVFMQSTRERDTIKEENNRLKALLAQHGISYDFHEDPVHFKSENSGYGSSGSISGSYGATSSGSGLSPPHLNGGSHAMQGTQNQPQSRTLAQLPNSHHDYDQLALDFVLTLERPCMEHMQYLVTRSHNSDEQAFHHPSENPDDREFEHMSGHAMMSTCPPQNHVKNTPNAPYPFKMPDLSMPDLKKLLDLSARLPLNPESEVTPIMAWTLIFMDPRINELDATDIARIKDELSTKVRCYGFGAVLEDFEVRDALGSVLSEKDSMQALDRASISQNLPLPQQQIQVA